MSRRPGAQVAFLFLGETLLIPHLYPIVEALAARAPGLAIDLWLATSAHEALVAPWISDLGQETIRLRRAPGFRRLAGHQRGHNPPLPSKMPLLARLLPHIWSTPVAVCAEQTSLWIPTLTPAPVAFVKTSHGVGSMSARDDRRRRSARITLVPSERERRTYLDRGFDPARIFATGYVKSAFRHRSEAAVAFPEPRPIVLYAPHWQAHRSSWWRWGRQVVAALADHPGYNLVFAPHQRLVENAPELRGIVAGLAGRPNVRCDLDGFAMVDGTYTAAADIYLGDTSSQVIEFLMRPRPCVFLNALGVAWAEDPAHDQWRCGEVVESLDDLLPALQRAPARHAAYADAQAAFARASLGEVGPEAPRRAAAHILDLLAELGRR